MSGENVLSFFSKSKTKSTRDPLEESLRIENDRRLHGCIGIGSIFGIAFVSYALSVHILPLLPPTICVIKPPDDGTVVIVKLPPNQYRNPTRKIARHNQPRHDAPLAHTAHPIQKPSGQLATNVITSLTPRADYTASDLIHKALGKTDLDKLDHFGSVKRGGQTDISGRKGRYSDRFNDSYLEGGNGKGTDDLPVPGLTESGIKGELKNADAPAAQVDISMQSAQTARSSASILAVIRSHAPGLRHIYNTYLRIHPGMHGKVTLTFAIAPSGQVVDVGLAGSTTGAEDFDKDVSEKIMAWRFDPVHASGNDIVTVPFNFSE